MGFSKGSKASLLAGGGTGALVVYAAQDLRANRTWLLALLLLLGTGMGVRAARSGKVMPAGAIAVSALGIAGMLAAE